MEIINIELVIFAVLNESYKMKESAFYNDEDKMQKHLEKVYLTPKTIMNFGKKLQDGRFGQVCLNFEEADVSSFLRRSSAFEIACDSNSEVFRYKYNIKDCNPEMFRYDNNKREKYFFLKFSNEIRNLNYSHKVYSGCGLK